MSQISPAKAQRARENRAYVRALLREQADRHLPPHWPSPSSMPRSACLAGGRTEMIAHRFHRLDDRRPSHRSCRVRRTNRSSTRPDPAQPSAPAPAQTPQKSGAARRAPTARIAAGKGRPGEPSRANRAPYPGSFGNQVFAERPGGFTLPGRPAGREEQTADGPRRANHSNDAMPAHPGGGEA